MKDDDCISCRYSRELLNFILIFPAIYFHVIFFHCLVMFILIYFHFPGIFHLIYRKWQGGITCGAIDEPRKPSKAIDERVIINFRDKNAVIARFGFACHDLSCYVMICHEGAPSPLPALYATLSRI